ncbi:hypothetical protein PSPO01_05505 [Paraphaeosphaeria sporulosa]
MFPGRPVSGQTPIGISTSPTSNAMPHEDTRSDSPFFTTTLKEDVGSTSVKANAPFTPSFRSPSQSSLESDFSWTATPVTPLTSVNDTSTHVSQDTSSENVDDNRTIVADADLDMGDATDAEDNIVTVPINFDNNGMLKEYHIDIRETELLAGQEQGYAYIGIEHEETEEQAITREDKAKEKGWMDGWLARKNPTKYQIQPRKWVPNGEGGGRWVEVDLDKRLRVIVEWKRARYRDGRWFVELRVLEREHTRLEKLSSPPLRFKIEVTRPRAPQRSDPLTGRSLRFQPPLMGTFSEGQEWLLEGKEWPTRRLAEMRGKRRSQRVADRKAGKTNSR